MRFTIYNTTDITQSRDKKGKSGLLHFIRNDGGLSLRMTTGNVAIQIFIINPMDCIAGKTILQRHSRKQRISPKVI